MNIRFEMRFKCGSNLKVLDPLRAFGKTLTFVDAFNGTSNHGVFHKAWDSDFRLLRWREWLKIVHIFRKESLESENAICGGIFIDHLIFITCLGTLILTVEAESSIVTP